MEKSNYNSIKLGQVLDLKTGEGVYLQAGNAQIWMKKTPQTTQLFYQYQTGRKSAVPPKDAIWSKWVTTDKKIHLEFFPCFPEMAVQLTFNEPLFVPDGKEISFYYLFPAWIMVTMGKQQDVLLGEFPTLQLSHTWSGNLFEGELIFEDFTEIYLDNPENKDFAKITCPVQIANKGNANFIAGKQILRLENLGIYANEQNFWSTRTRFEYTKNNELTDVKFNQAYLKSMGNFSQIQKPRNLTKKSFLLRSVSPIKMKHTLILPNR